MLRNLNLFDIFITYYKKSGYTVLTLAERVFFFISRKFFKFIVLCLIGTGDGESSLKTSGFFKNFYAIRKWRDYFLSFYLFVFIFLSKGTILSSLFFPDVIFYNNYDFILTNLEGLLSDKDYF